MRLGNAYIKRGRLLIHKFNPDDPQFFHGNTLYAGYGFPLDDNPSLLNIPLVSSLVTYCWLMDKDLYVPTLDEQYVTNLEKLRRVFEDAYHVDFKSELVVKKTENNLNKGDKPLLFFSGGLDSTYSFYVNQDKNPDLFMICGYDMYMNHGRELEIRDKWVKTYGDFAYRHDVNLSFCYTNTRWVVHEDAVNRANTKPLKRGYWDALRHGICLTGMGAPIIGGYNEIIISSNGCREWDTTTYDNPYGTGFNIAPMLTYANRDIQYCCDADRFIKARNMKEFLNSGNTALRVCYKPVPELNCMKCEKCLRTLSQIVLAGVNPTLCGMAPPKDAWRNYTEMFKNHKIGKRLIRIHFTRMQKYLKTHDVTLPPEPQTFYDYVRGADFNEYLNALAKTRGED